MAFTAVHVAKVLLHLEYPAAPWAKATIETSLNNITAISSDLETQAIAIITEMDQLQSDIAAHVHASAGVQVETTGVVYFPTLAIAELKARYRDRQKLLAQISMLQCPNSSSRVVLG